MEQRLGAMLVFVFVLLMTFAFLVSVMPFGSTKKYRTEDMEKFDGWNGKETLIFADSWNATMTTGYDSGEFWVGGRCLQLKANYQVFPYMNQIFILQNYGYFRLYSEGGTWYNSTGQIVSWQQPITGHQMINGEVLDTEYNHTGRLNFDLRFYQVSPFLIRLWFTWNRTTYTQPSTAWHNNAITVSIGIEPDEVNTALNAWDLAMGLLTFQTLEVFGTEDTTTRILNAIIALPILISIAFIVFVLVLELLKAIIPF